MKKFNLTFILAVTMFAAVSCKNDDDDNDSVTDQLTDSDRTFVMNAADGGMFEVMAGQLAIKMDSMMVDSMATDSMAMDSMGTGTATGMGLDSAGIRSFARMMVTDHSKANNDLKTLAAKKSVTLPTTLSTAKQQKLDSLNAMSGSAFNRAYIKMMVSSHQETVDMFQKESDSESDADLKSFVSTWLPTFKTHLQHAQMLQDSL
jgi:putative membrane protein